MNLSSRDSSREEFYNPGTNAEPGGLSVPAAGGNSLPAVTGVPSLPTPPAGGASSAVSRLSDIELERCLSSLVSMEAEATAEVVEHIAEFEGRRLFAPKSFPSMFVYCTKVLGYSEGAAYLRIYAGRLSREYPEILDLLRSRRLHLTAIRTVGPHLNAENRRGLLEKAVSKSERELKILIAEARPKEEPREVIRRLPMPAPAITQEFARSCDPRPEPSPAAPPPSEAPSSSARPLPPASAAAPPMMDPEPPEIAPEPPVPEERSSPAAVPDGRPRPASVPEEAVGSKADMNTLPRPPRVPPSPPSEKIEPLGRGRVRFAFTGSVEFFQRYERARELLGHRRPSGAQEAVFRHAVEALLDARDPERKAGRARKPPAGGPGTRPRTRRIAAWIKHAVYKRDEGRCSYRSADGTRCEERGGLDFDHIIPLGQRRSFRRSRQYPSVVPHPQRVRG